MGSLVEELNRNVRKRTKPYLDEVRPLEKRLRELEAEIGRVQKLFGLLHRPGD